jgi:hypothetical protein
MGPRLNERPARYVDTEWRTLDHGFTGAAMPARMSTAAVAEADLMTNEHLASAELVAVRASRRRVDDPLSRCGLYEIAQHKLKPRTTSRPLGARPRAISQAFRLNTSCGG